MDKVSLARREAGFENDMADGVVTALIVLEDVRVGDVVRIGYSVIGSNPIMAGQISDWCGSRGPIRCWNTGSAYCWIPAPRPASTGAAARHGKRSVNAADALEVTLRSNAVAPVVNEEGYPNWYQPYQQAQVGLDQSWADVVSWGLPLYPPEQALPEELESKLAEWRALPGDDAAHYRCAAHRAGPGPVFRRGDGGEHASSGGAFGDMATALSAIARTRPTCWSRCCSAWVSRRCRRWYRWTAGVPSPISFLLHPTSTM